MEDNDLIIEQNKKLVLHITDLLKEIQEMTDLFKLQSQTMVVINNDLQVTKRKVLEIEEYLRR